MKSKLKRYALHYIPKVNKHDKEKSYHVQRWSHTSPRLPAVPQLVIFLDQAAFEYLLT